MEGWRDWREGGGGREGGSVGGGGKAYNCGPAKEEGWRRRREGWNGYCESQAAAAVLCLSECGVGAGVTNLALVAVG